MPHTGGRLNRLPVCSTSLLWSRRGTRSRRRGTRSSRLRPSSRALTWRSWPGSARQWKVGLYRTVASGLPRKHLVEDQRFPDSDSARRAAEDLAEACSSGQYDSKPSS